MPLYSNRIKLRPAVMEDLDLLKHWDEQPHNIESDPNDDWSWEEELPSQPSWRHQLIAELDGRPIGFIQIIDPHEEESHYWGEIAPGLRAIDIWIGEKEDLGKGYGTKMMRRAIDLCFDGENAEAIVIDPLASNKKAHRFYERLGFRFVEERWFGEDFCFVYRLEKSDWER